MEDAGTPAQRVATAGTEPRPLTVGQPAALTLHATRGPGRSQFVKSRDSESVGTPLASACVAPAHHREGGRRRRRGLPARERLSNLEAELQGDHVGQAKVEGAVGAQLPCPVSPTSQKKLTIVDRHVEHDARSDLELEPRAHGRAATPRVEAPFVAIDHPARRRPQVRGQTRDAGQMHAQLRSQLLEDGQAQKVRRVLPRELVGAAEVPWPSRAVAHADREPSAVAEDTRHRSSKQRFRHGAARVAGADLPCRSDGFSRQSNAIL